MSAAAPIVAVVDDDPAMSRAMARAIELAGATPVTFDSAEAMLAAAPGPVACIVIDVHLAGMDGVELREQLVARGDCPPVIFVSGSEEAEQQVRQLPGGPHIFLPKPFSMHALLGAIERLAGIAARGEVAPLRRRSS